MHYTRLEQNIFKAIFGIDYGQHLYNVAQVLFLGKEKKYTFYAKLVQDENEELRNLERIHDNTSESPSTTL